MHQVRGWYSGVAIKMGRRYTSHGLGALGNKKREGKGPAGGHCKSEDSSKLIVAFIAPLREILFRHV